MYALYWASLTYVCCRKFAAAKAIDHEIVALAGSKDALHWKALGMLQRGRRSGPADGTPTFTQAVQSIWPTIQPGCRTTPGISSSRLLVSTADIETPKSMAFCSSIFRIELDCLIAVAQRLIGLALLDMRRATVGVEDCKTRAVIPARVDGSREARPRQGVARNRLEIGLRDQTAPALQPPSSSAAARRDNWCDHCNETSLALPRRSIP